MRPSLLLVLLGTLLLAPPLSAGCPELDVRTWEPDGRTSWFDSTAPVPLRVGQEAHLYLYLDTGTRPRHQTKSEIRTVLDREAPISRRESTSRLQGSEQSAEDRSVGMFRIHALKPGDAYLHYEVQSVHPPGSIDRLPARCREGVLHVRIEPESDDAVPPPVSDDHGPEAAARQLVEDLYVALLRREDAGDVDGGFVDHVLRDAEAGLVEVASQITTSSEFRDRALQRTEERAGSGKSLSELREILLLDIYRDLYGYEREPNRRVDDENLEALAVCLSGSRNAERACADFGEGLVRSRLYTDHHRELLDELSDRRRPRENRLLYEDRG